MRTTVPGHELSRPGQVVPLSTSIDNPEHRARKLCLVTVHRVVLDLFALTIGDHPIGFEAWNSTNLKRGIATGLWYEIAWI